jgi:hypothetical protein
MRMNDSLYRIALPTGASIRPAAGFLTDNKLDQFYQPIREQAANSFIDRTSDETPQSSQKFSPDMSGDEF